VAELKQKIASLMANNLQKVTDLKAVHAIELAALAEKVNASEIEKTKLHAEISS